MATPKRKEQTYLNPVWLRDTAALAIKHGTAIIVSKSRQVYGIVGNTGGSVTVFFKGDDEWVDEILLKFPDGAVFPADSAFGGSGASKALKAYANVRLPDDGGRAWIDPVTMAVHVKGLGTTIHSSAFSANESPLVTLPCETSPLSFDETVSQGIGKLMAECVTVQATRPALARIVQFDHRGESHLAATDGKSAVFHKCPDVPDGFSVDPKVVGLFDICAYGMEEDDVSATETRSYVLKDGTVLMERIGKVTPIDYSNLMSSVIGVGAVEFVGSLQLATLLDSVKEMGLGVNDAFGGVVRFRPETTELLSMGTPLAEFDLVGNFSEICDFHTFNFSVPLLRRVASLGGGLWLGGSNKGIAMSTAGGTVMLAMPLKTESGAATA